MNEIILGEEQIYAINKIKDFINSDKLCFSLYGSAGTGKTTITKYIIDYLEKQLKRYVLCAPTHQAKVVLENLTGRNGITLHKLLSLSPNIEILNLDFNNLSFIVGNSLELFPSNGIIFCDESSMINDDLFDLLLTKSEQTNCKIIFQGDKCQLQPVNSLTHSKVFDVEDRVELTKIYRQSSESGLITVLPTLRKSIIGKFEEAIGTDGSLLCYNNTKDFFIKSLPYFKKAIKNNKSFDVKLLAYTNARSSSFNRKYREVLFDINKEYNKHEILVGTENLEFNGTFFWNSMNYVIIDEPRKDSVLIPGFIKLPGYYLSLYNESTKIIEEVFILSKEISKDYFNSLAYYIEDTRLKAISAKKMKYRYAGKLWSKYYSIIKSFTTPVDLYYSNRLIRKKSFDYGYALTVHKS